MWRKKCPPDEEGVWKESERNCVIGRGVIGNGDQWGRRVLVIGVRDVFRDGDLLRAFRPWGWFSAGVSGAKNLHRAGGAWDSFSQECLRSKVRTRLWVAKFLNSGAVKPQGDVDEFRNYGVQKLLPRKK